MGNVGVLTSMVHKTALDGRSLTSFKMFVMWVESLINEVQKGTKGPIK